MVTPTRARSRKRWTHAKGAPTAATGPLLLGDGARIGFDGRGYGLRNAGRYVWTASLGFRSEAVEYEWLAEMLAVMEGDFDERAGRVVWHVFTPNAIAR